MTNEGSAGPSAASGPAVATATAAGRVGLRRAPLAGALLILGASMLLNAQGEEAFFDATVDGSWVGSIEFKKNPGTQFPIQLNLNAQGSGGIGFALLPDDLVIAPTRFESIEIQNLKVKGKKVNFAVDSEISELAFKLKYKAATDTLRGMLTASDAALGKATVKLHRMDPAKPMQKTWFKKISAYGKKKPLTLQVIQPEPAAAMGLATASRPGDAGGFAKARGMVSEEAPVPVSGFGFLGQEFGPILDGKISGNALTGSLDLPSGELDFDLTLVKQSLKGKVQGEGVDATVRLPPAGTKGLATKVTQISPAQLEAGASMIVRVKGKNFAMGTMAHVTLDPPGAVSATAAGAAPLVQVASVNFQNKKEIRVRLEADPGLAAGATLSMRVLGVDGQQVDQIQALTIGAPTAVSFADDIQPVFDESCALAGCHSGANPQALLNLTAGAAYGNIVNVPSSQMLGLNRITPGDPDNSYLIRKLKGTGIIGARMPQNAPPLSDIVIGMFETWVIEGAENN